MREISFVPDKLSGFKYGKYLTLPSLIYKYQGFCPGAQPLIEGSNTDLQTFYDYHISFLDCNDRSATND